MTVTADSLTLGWLAQYGISDSPTHTWIVVENRAERGGYVTLDFEDGVEVRREPSSFREIVQFDMRSPFGIQPPLY